MSEVAIKFGREEREGIVPVGIYLIDAASRFGIRIDDSESAAGNHSCSVGIETGSDLLSPLTKVEQDYFAAHGRKDNERLACQTKIDRSGDVTIMTDEKKATADESETTADANERFRKEFEDMPLEKKIANLLQLEFMALGETVTFVMNSPSKIIEKVMDVMAEFGLKKEEAAKQATRPEEHKTEPKSKGKRAGGNAPVAG